MADLDKSCRVESWIKRGFEGESHFHLSSPTANYYWYRKRLELKRLFTANRDLIKSHLGGQATFLDLGCSNGTDIFLFHDLFQQLGIPFARVVGMEGDLAAREIFELRREWSRKNIEFVPGNVEEPLPFPDHAFDCVYCSEVMEHLIDPEKFCAEISRILKPNGLLILTTPNQPNVFQKGYWLPGAKRRLAEMRNRLLQEGQTVTENNKTFKLYGHISLLTCRKCDEMLKTKGLRLLRYRRGAIRYGGTAWYDSPFILAIYFFIEGVLDLLPLALTRTLSDQIISMYEKAP
jgi:SAM-dependent methyltransferase